MVEDESASETSNKTTSDSESLKIPDFLDCTITANAKTVIYDNLNLKNVKGPFLVACVYFSFNGWVCSLSRCLNSVTLSFLKVISTHSFSLLKAPGSMPKP